MRTRISGLCLATILAAAAASRGQAPTAAPAPGGKPSGSIESRLVAYMGLFLPWDPVSKVSVERSSEKLPGFQGWKVKRTGKYPKLAVDKVVYVSDDGRWLFDGDTTQNPKPPAQRSASDLSWIEARTTALYRARVRALPTPERDAAGLKAIAVAVESGYGPMRVPGYVSADGSRYFNGPLWDLQMDPREERRRRIDLTAPRFEGRPEGSVVIVEYADMECGYCRYRGTQLDALLDTNRDVLSYKRYYKFFPLWFSHAWAMKAASAGDCFFRLSPGPAMFEFKKQVYAQQPVLTVSGIDELAIQFAEASGIPRADFLACYLRDESLADVRKDLEEGQRLEVHSTPTYFVDGTVIQWIEDKVMEDFLRTKAPGLKGIPYEAK